MTDSSSSMQYRPAFHNSPYFHTIQDTTQCDRTKNINYLTCKGKGLPQKAKVAQGVPGRLRPRIFLTFGTTRVVGRQPYALAAFTQGEIPGTHFYRLSPPQGTW